MKHAKNLFLKLSLASLMFTLMMAAAPVMAQEKPASLPILPNNGTRMVPRACWKYDIKIKGTVNGIWFERSAKLGIALPTVDLTPSNDLNVYEMWIASGNPYNSPSKGAIIYTTNTFFADSSIWDSDKFDIAYVDNTSTTIYTYPDDTYTGLFTNYYTFNSNFALRYIDTGYIRATFSDGGAKVSGKIDVRYSVYTGKYDATFTGKRVSTSSTSSCKFTNK